MSWRFITFDKSISQKQCSEFLNDEKNMHFCKLFRIQKTSVNNLITLKLYLNDGVDSHEAEKDAIAFVTFMHINSLFVRNHDFLI